MTYTHTQSHTPQYQKRLNQTDKVKVFFLLNLPYLTYLFWGQCGLMKMIFMSEGYGLHNASVLPFHLLELRKGHGQFTTYSLSRQIGIIF